MPFDGLLGITKFNGCSSRANVSHVVDWPCCISRLPGQAGPAATGQPAVHGVLAGQAGRRICRRAEWAGVREFRYRREPRWSQIEHDLAVNDFRLDVIQACAQHRPVHSGAVDS